MKEHLLFFNKKNKNGRIYKVENLINLDFSKEKYVEKNVSCDPEVRLDLLCGRILDMEIIDEVLVGNFVPIDGYIRPENTVIRPTSLANIGEDGVAKNVDIVKFAIIKKEDDSFREFYE